MRENNLWLKIYKPAVTWSDIPSVFFEGNWKSLVASEGDGAHEASLYIIRVLPCFIAATKQSVFCFECVHSMSKPIIVYWRLSINCLV